MKTTTVMNAFAAVASVVALGASVAASGVSAKDETPDVQAFLPLLKRNSIVGKVLDVTYSLNYEEEVDGSVSSRKQDTRLVFDAPTGRCRKETKHYLSPAEAKEYDYDYELAVDMWDGKEHASWSRLISQKPGFRMLKQGVYEHPGSVVVTDRNSFATPPSFVMFCLDESLRPFAETVPKQSPKLALAGNTVTVETEGNRFEFSRKTAALERLSSYGRDEDGKRIVIRTLDLSDHVERSGVWIPLKIVDKVWLNNQVIMKAEQTADPKKLRLLDKVDAPSTFNETFPAGCFVKDDIRNKSYRVATPAPLPSGAEALKQTFEKMLGPAQEQKKTTEQER